MEASQMLKFWLKKDCLNFMKDWITPQKDMAFNEDNNDLLAQLFSTANASSLDDILSSIVGDDVSSSTVIFWLTIMYYCYYCTSIMNWSFCLLWCYNSNTLHDLCFQHQTTNWLMNYGFDYKLAKAQS